MNRTLAAAGAWLRGAIMRQVGRDPAELLRVSFEALGRYKLRTSLSVLGIVLGVAAVIAMMSVSDGARRDALEQFAEMGLDNLVARGKGGGATLTAGDAVRLSSLVPLTRAVSPLVERFIPVSRSGKRMTTSVIGVSATYQTILRLDVPRGRFISSLDEQQLAKVCVLGNTLARALFEYEDPIGQSVRIESDYYQVVGVIGGRGAGSESVGTLAWRDLDQSVLAPLSTLTGRTVEIDEGQRIDEIWLQASDASRVEELGRVMQHTLGRLHGAADVDIVVPRELLNQRYRTQRTFSVVVGSIAVLALVVGGIGIMNIMLTSVMERTHEIGIRRTVGATRRDVAVQFLAEALLMTASGGIIGILIGAFVSWGITAYAGWSTHVSPVSVVLACGVSVAVGLGFGLYPAVRASRLEPVDAIRYE